MKNRLWTREEFILVLNLYTKIRYGQFNATNAEVKRLALLLDRTPGAVAYKLVHFSGMDAAHIGRIKGLANPGTKAVEIYNEFVQNWDEMLFESEVLLAKYQNKRVEEISLEKEEMREIKMEALSGKNGIDVQRLVKTRVNQSLFRKIVLNNYADSCAICGLDIQELVVASHILKWSEHHSQRLNPENGLCLCNIHDKAFETGYIGITGDYRILISKELGNLKEKQTINALFQRHQNQKLNLPDKFYPNPSFLEEHYANRFRK